MPCLQLLRLARASVLVLPCMGMGSKQGRGLLHRRHSQLPPHLLAHMHAHTGNRQQWPVAGTTFPADSVTVRTPAPPPSVGASLLPGSSSCLRLGSVPGRTPPLQDLYFFLPPHFPTGRGSGKPLDKISGPDPQTRMRVWGKKGGKEKGDCRG